jgi:hypothetical protein
MKDFTKVNVNTVFPLFATGQLLLYKYYNHHLRGSINKKESKHYPHYY